MRSRIAPMLLVLLFLAAMANAQYVPLSTAPPTPSVDIAMMPGAPHTLTVTATTKQIVQPDAAVITLEIRSVNATVADAVSANAVAAREIVDAITLLKIPGVSYQSYGFIFSPTLARNMQPAKPPSVEQPVPEAAPAQPVDAPVMLQANDAPIAPGQPLFFDQVDIVVAPGPLPTEAVPDIVPPDPPADVAPSDEVAYSAGIVLDIKVQMPENPTTDAVSLSEAVGRIITTSQRTPGTTLSGARFFLANENDARTQLVGKAGAAAHSRALAIAQGIGATLGPVIAVSDSSDPIETPAPATAAYRSPGYWSMPTPYPPSWPYDSGTIFLATGTLYSGPDLFTVTPRGETFFPLSATVTVTYELKEGSVTGAEAPARN
jgi:uncharacterized protein YggE